jgi:drug/metabolite transporter (DMT)-like permease
MNINVNSNTGRKLGQMANLAKNIGNTRETLNISWNTIGIITLLGTMYIVAASVGINTFSNCEKFKGKRLQENLNKVLVATLGMALAIPFTLSMTKMFSNEMPVFLLTYAIMGVIGSSIALNWTVNCEEAEKRSITTIGVSLASFIAMLMFGVFLIVPKGKLDLE